MKRILFSVIFTVLVFTSKSALAASAYNWTGFYAGLQGSYDVGTSDFDWTLYHTHADHIIKGVMGGILFGYNYQTPVNVVVGVDVDFNGGKIAGSSSCPNNSFDCRTEVNWVGSARARVGYAVSRFLPYAAVGIAYSQVELFANETATGTEDENTKNTYFGWTPSIGVDFAFTKNLIGRFEYAYYDFASNNVTTTGKFIENIDSKIKFQSFTLGLTWKF
ncbi:MAG: outer membrane protein [Smithellaceae bacterium]|jgi:outer membrane immunogenic protein